jgi:CDAN1-interacting nuclease 1
MKKQEFERIIRTICSQRGATTCRSSMVLLRQTFPEVPELTLRSILSQELCRKMKISHYRYKAKGEDYFARYMQRRETPNKTFSLMTMASEIGINPALLARIILDVYLTSKNESAEAEFSVSKHITRMLRDTSLIEDRQLAQDVHLCVLEDDQYGPLADAINHSLGQQYEHLLGLQLTKLKIPFLNEDQMRNLGMDKTPDIKLEVNYFL